MLKHPEKLSTASLTSDANVLAGKITTTDVESLKETGDLAARVRVDPENGHPVLYLWQSFALFRLDVQQMLTLQALISETLYTHFQNPVPPKKEAKKERKRPRMQKINSLLS